MRPWLETVLEVVVMGATMCSGIIVPKDDVPIGDGEPMCWSTIGRREMRR